MAAAKEFNIGTNTLIDFLISKSFSGEDLKPTTKLSEEMYRVLQSEFQGDKAAKQKAEQIDLPKGAGANEHKKKRDEEDLSIKKKEEKPKAKEEQPVAPVAEPTSAEGSAAVLPNEKDEKVKAAVKEEEKEKEPTLSKINAPELESPKVLDKIDLDAIDSSTRPKKSAKKEKSTTEEIKKSDKPEAEEKKKSGKTTVQPETEMEVVKPIVPVELLETVNPLK